MAVDDVHLEIDVPQEVVVIRDDVTGTLDERERATGQPSARPRLTAAVRTRPRLTATVDQADQP